MSSIAEIKSAIHQQFASTEDWTLLLKFRICLRTINKKDRHVVAYNSKLNPLTIEQYRLEVKKSMAQHRVGKVISQKEMEKSL